MNPLFMNTPLSPQILAFLQNLNGGETIGLFCSVGGLIFAAVMGLGGMYFRHRQLAQWHETARVALEKGQPVPLPPEGMDDHKTAAPLFNQSPEQRAIQQRAARIRGYLISGFINIAVGLGSFFALVKLRTHLMENVQYFALIPAFIGLALLLGAAVEIIAGQKLDKTS